MEKRSNWSYGLWIAILFFGGSFFMFAGSCMNMARENVMEPQATEDSVMVLDLKGVIFDSKKFLKKLKHYREEDSIKGFLIRIDSPGGVVGPSQELNAEIKRTREEFKKPVVVYSENLNASGAYYASVAADKIIVAPGSLIGSIGVIMEFANLRDLYKWAKVERFSIKTGDFKDIGAEYREMRMDEKAYLQTMLNQVLVQFKDAIKAGRKIDPKELDRIADGRIFTGQQAKEFKLVDETGFFQTAVDIAGELSGLGKNPELFELPKERGDLLQYLLSAKDSEEEEASSQLAKFVRQFADLKFSGQLLMVYPGAVSASLLGGMSAAE